MCNHVIGLHTQSRQKYLTPLMKMSSPVKLPVLWARMTSASTVIDELRITDVQPLLLVGAEPELTAMVSPPC